MWASYAGIFKVGNEAGSGEVGGNCHLATEGNQGKAGLFSPGWPALV